MNVNGMQFFVNTMLTTENLKSTRHVLKKGSPSNTIIKTLIELGGEASGEVLAKKTGQWPSRYLGKVIAKGIIETETEGSSTIYKLIHLNKIEFTGE